MTIESFIHDLPKCELHVHIEGTLEPDLKFRLAERNRIDLPFKDEREMRAAVASYGERNKPEAGASIPPP